MRRTSVVNVAGVLGSFVVLWSAWPAPPVAGAPVGNGARLEDAVRFRSDFGLQDAASFVASTFNDEAFSDVDWGVPLAKSERDDLARRTLVREDIQLALEIAVKSPTYAGAYIDQRRGGIPVFLSTEPLAMSATLESALPADAVVEFAVAARTEFELDALQDAVQESIPQFEAQGVDLVSIGIDVVNNRVAVGIQGRTPAADLALQSKFGSGVYTYEQGPIYNDGCTSMAWCWPMKGGLQMFAGSPTKHCTTGFLARKTNDAAMVMVTAGHCLPQVSGTTWGHALTPSGAEDFGWELENTWFDYARADVGLIKLRAAAVSALEGKNTIHYQDPSYNEGVVAVRDHAYQLTGDSVCLMGWGRWNKTRNDTGVGQGMKCGTVGRRDVTNKSCPTPGSACSQPHIMHTWEYSFDAISGDSGGPVYHRVFASPPYLTAYGTHVHSDVDSALNAKGWYSPVLYGRNAYELLQKGYTYNVCTSYAC